MGAPKGNQFWKIRSSHGRKKIFETPEILWDAACEYFDWCENNPLYSAQPFSFQGESWLEDVPKMRAMTMEGLCLFLHVNTLYFNDFERNLDISTDEGKDFSIVIKNIRETIKNQKFVGAAAGLLNANIIARDLGLSDKKELDHTSSDGSMTPKGKSLDDFYDEIPKESSGS